MKTYRISLYIALLLFVTLFALPSYSALQSQPNTAAVDSKVGFVTVYRDRALVTRIVRVELTPGEHRLAFEPLPLNLTDESVQVRGKAAVPVTILGVETQRIFPAETARERVRELEREIEELQSQSYINAAEIQALEAEREFLSSLRVHTGEQIGREIAAQQTDTRRWDTTLEYIRSKHEGNLKKSVEKKSEQDRLQKEIDRLRNELQQYTGTQRSDAKRATVRLRTDTRTTLTLELSYLIGGASWQPVYDARVTGDDNRVRLIYNAAITQRTGEDWQGAELILSTARPAVGARMPELRPWILSLAPPVRLYEDVRKQRSETDMVSAPAEAAMEAVAVGAVAEEQITSMIFRVPGLHTVPGDGSSHRVLISEYTLEGAKQYVTTPKLSPFAYLRVKTVNETRVDLLPGNMNIFLDNDYVGRSDLVRVAPGETFEMFLGIDEGIKVTRNEVSRKVDEGSFLSRRKKTDLVYAIEIQNNKRNPVNIVVYDQLPVSQHSDIEVRSTRIQPEPSAPDPDNANERAAQGMLKWNLTIPAGGKQEIRIEFFVRHPLDMDVTGI
jgi:uncharacterized protein (TIGR02231 family)